MTEKTNTAKVDDVLKLVRPGNAQTETGSSDPVAGLLLGSPKFSTPANDEPNLPRLAPQCQEGRRARLVRMWIEVLAETEQAT